MFQTEFLWTRSRPKYVYTNVIRNFWLESGCAEGDRIAQKKSLATFFEHVSGFTSTRE